MAMYEGKEPCAGCGRTGEEVARKSKVSLCRECQEAVELGRALIKEKNLERNFYRLDGFKIGELTWYQIRVREIETALVKLLKQFSEFDRNNVTGSREILAGRYDALTGRHQIVLPAQVFEAASNLCKVIKEECDKIQQERYDYKKEVMKEVNAYKNDIYNEGVEKGRNLLFQLNAGEITAEDFNKRIDKF